MALLEQCAALPYIKTERGLLVLLVTTRGTGRWTIPKGWPKAGLSNSELAAREAFEEAGVAGEISNRPLGVLLIPSAYFLLVGPLSCRSLPFACRPPAHIMARER